MSNAYPSKKKQVLTTWSWLFLALAVLSTLSWTFMDVHPDIGISLAVLAAAIAAILGGIGVATKRTVGGMVCIVLSVLVIAFHVILIIALRNMCVIC